MHPMLFELGPLKIRYYGLMYALAITCTLLLLPKEIRRKHLPLSEDDVLNFILLCVIGGIVGARLYYVTFQWDSYRTALSEIVKVWHGGLAIHGGILGGVLAGWWFIRRQQVPFLQMADLSAPFVILGQTFGRFGNFMNGDAHGIPTTMPWGVVFPPGSIAGDQYPGIPLHPVMLYEMALNASIFLLLWHIRKMPWKDGFLSALYLILYSVGRFGVSFFRADNLMLGSFSIAHLVSVGLVCVMTGLIINAKLWERRPSAK